MAGYMTSRQYSTWQIYRSLLSEARPFWSFIAAVFALNLLATPLKLLAPVPLKIVVDYVLVFGEEPVAKPFAIGVPFLENSSQQSLLILAIVLLLAIAFISYLNALLIRLLHGYTAEKLVVGFRSRLFQHVQNLSLRYHDEKGSTDSTYRIQYDAPAIQWIVLDGVIPFLAAFATVIAMFVVTWTLDWQLAIVAAALAPVLLFVTHTWGRGLRRQWREVKQLQSDAMSVVQECFSGIRVVKAFGGESREQQRFHQHAYAGLKEQMRVLASQGTFELVAGMIVATGTALALYLGVQHVLSGQLTLGNFLLVWAYLGQLYGPLQTISGKITTLQGSLASAERALTLLDRAPEVVELPNARPIDRSRGGVKFDGVSFSYDVGKPVLTEVSFEVHPGTSVGIAGPSGVGKSTLMNLLLRFYDPTEGAIQLDGVDLRNYRLSDLRDQFSVVLQEPLLFHASIRENIAYAKPGATDEEIAAAAVAANVENFVAKLPDGYDTIIGERGMRLSGGERQRIAVARAFLKDAPILILDEPTSAIDVGTESILLESLQRLIEGKTVFMIAHRASTLAGCDVMFSIEEGRIASATTKERENQIVVSSQHRPVNE
jgi:ATP-binding cassette subfamily B protein